MSLPSRAWNAYRERGIRAVVEGVERSAKSRVERAWMDASWRLPGPPNRWNVRVFAPRRSGHHAIVNWIRDHVPGRHCFLNNCEPGSNPFATCMRGTSRVRGFFGDHGYVNWEQEIAGRHAKKGTLVHNYEDADLGAWGVEDLDAHERRTLGETARRTTIVILRDPFNLIASRLRWALGTKAGPAEDEFHEIRRVWKIHARECAGDTCRLPEKVCIDYNAWFTSRSYRDEIAGKIGFANRDLGLNRVARVGPTRHDDLSFDGLEFDGRAQEMGVLERWKAFRDDPFYLRQFEDGELLELAGRLYDEVAVGLGR